MVQERFLVTVDKLFGVICDLSNNDIEWPLMPVSRS